MDITIKKALTYNGVSLQPGQSARIPDADALALIASHSAIPSNQAADKDERLLSQIATLGLVQTTTDSSGNTIGLVDPSGKRVFAQIKSTAAVRKVFSGAGQAISAGLTVITQVPAAASFFAVQLVYFNHTGSAVTIDIAKVAPSPTHQNDGTGLTWTAVTFGGSGSGVIPASTSGTGNDIVPGMLVSDLIPVASLARTDDVTKLPLLQTRTYSSAASSAFQVAGTDIANFNAGSASNGMQYASRLPAGDLVTTITASQPLEAGTTFSPAAVRFYYSQRSVTIGVAGDSLSRGQASTANAYGWPLRAASLLANSSRYVSAFNAAWSGQKHGASMLIAKQIIANVKPDALAFFAWSPNDGAATQAVMDTEWAKTLEVIELCRQNNIQPIVCTSPPVNAYSTADNGRRVAQNARVLALANVCTVVDFDAAIRDPANPTQILPAYNSGDGLHYNDSGYLAMGVAFAAVAANI